MNFKISYVLFLFLCSCVEYSTIDLPDVNTKTLSYKKVMNTKKLLEQKRIRSR
jgi:hypothetical protein